MNIDDIDKTTENDTSDIDKKVLLKFFKEKKTSRTYIIGLDKFMEVSEIDKLSKDIKKRLGTGSIKVEKDGTIAYGFQGDHREAIKKILSDRNLVPKEKIVI